MYYRKLAIAAGIILATTGPVLAAGSASATLAVSSSVAATCTISTTAMAFSAYDPVVTHASTALNGSGAVSVACTKGTSSLTIGVDNGANVSGSQRQLKGQTSSAMLQYNVYQPPNSTPGTACSYTSPTAWTTTGGGLFSITAATSKASRTYNICGQIPAGQDVSVDTNYTDTVNVTINY